jgi:hypothetical protein
MGPGNAVQLAQSHRARRPLEMIRCERCRDAGCRLTNQYGHDRLSGADSRLDDQFSPHLFPCRHLTLYAEHVDHRWIGLRDVGNTMFAVIQ